jgi:hypothetical protein
MGESNGAPVTTSVKVKLDGMKRYPNYVMRTGNGVYWLYCYIDRTAPMACSPYYEYDRTKTRFRD